MCGRAAKAGADTRATRYMIIISLARPPRQRCDEQRTLADVGGLVCGLLIMSDRWMEERFARVG